MSIRVGVLGAGRIGKIHCATLKAMNDRARLIAVCDPSLDDDWAKRLGIPYILKNENDLFSLDLDAVVIASPTNQHAHHIIGALDRGFAILCEKPVDLSLDAHFRIKELVHAKKSIMQIGFNRRFDADFAKIAHYHHDGKLGKPYLLRITSRDPGLPSRDYLRTSGGMFVDMTIHDFDMARFVMKSEVTEIFAFGARLIDETLSEFNDIDTAVITLKFTNGAFGVIDNSRKAIYGYDQRLEIFGSGGSLSNDNHRMHSIQMSDGTGCYQEPIQNFFLERYRSSYQREMEAFINCIYNGIMPTPSIDDAIYAMTLARCAEESLSSRRPVVLRVAL